MRLLELFLVILVVLVIVQAGPLRNGDCSVCGISNICENGDCYTENCTDIMCHCFKGWVGDLCHTKCRLDCNEGSCYVEDGMEFCACQFGYNSSANCAPNIDLSTCDHILWAGENLKVQIFKPRLQSNDELKDFICHEITAISEESDYTNTTEFQATPVKQTSKTLTDDQWLLFFAAIPVSMLCSFAVILYQLWKRKVLFAMRIIHYFHWQNNDDNKEYDAFISFRSCTEDEPWVLNTLITKLEKEMGFHLCIHLRDFPAGELISNNIIDAIEKSRRTILVISPDYVTSEWTRMEYQVAQQEMLKLRHKIIPIMYREISDADSMDKCLKYILRTVTYLKWPADTDDTKGQRRFWEQLKLTMPKVAVQTESPERNKG